MIFFRIRKDLFDLLQDLAELIGFDKVLFVLAEAIKSELPNLTPGKKVLANWATLEANLYGINAILKYGTYF